MIDLKKKLNAFLPGETTRGALQNVLTVEWSGHKTVLVEVPSGPPRSNDVELSPLREEERGCGDYGRLEDSDSDDFGRPVQGYFDQPRSSRDRKHSLGFSKSKSSSRSGPPPLPSRPQFNRPELGLNPFDSDPALSSRPNLLHNPSADASSSRRTHEGELSYQSAYTHKRANASQAPRPAAPISRQSKSEWTTFPSHSPLESDGGFDPKPAYRTALAYPVARGGGGKHDPWSHGGWSQTSSPASSTGTRNSGQLNVDGDPFREAEA